VALHVPERIRTIFSGKLAVLMFTAFMDMVGLLMIGPLLPFYAKDLGASALMLAIITSSFSAAQLLSSPFWGRVSDKYGRRPALLIGLGASAIAYVIFAFADSLWLLMLSRVVQGAGGGTVGVIQAYVADAVEPKNRARGLGWLSAATNTGVMIGPLLGSATAMISPRAPGLFAAGLCLLNILFAWRYLSESHDAAARVKARRGRSPSTVVWRVLWTHIGDPSSRLIWIYSIAIGAFYGITVSGVFTLFLIDRFDVSAATIGPIYSYYGILNVVFRVAVLGSVIDRLGELKTARLGIVLLALGLALMPLTSPIPIGEAPTGVALIDGVLRFLAHYAFLGVATALMPLGATLTFPCVTGLLSQVVRETERGVYMGVQQAFGGVVRVFYPMWAGFAWDELGTLVPFWTSAAFVMGTLGLGARLPAHAHALAEEEASRLEESEAKREAAIAE
jgi:MFS family permease